MNCLQINVHKPFWQVSDDSEQRSYSHLKQTIHPADFFEYKQVTSQVVHMDWCSFILFLSPRYNVPPRVFQSIRQLMFSCLYVNGRIFPLCLLFLPYGGSTRADRHLFLSLSLGYLFGWQGNPSTYPPISRGRSCPSKKPSYSPSLMHVLHSNCPGSLDNCNSSKSNSLFITEIIYNFKESEPLISWDDTHKPYLHFLRAFC